MDNTTQHIFFMKGRHMTKNVRIENADTGTHYQVRVQTWETRQDGENVMVDERVLSHPTMLDTFMIHASRYLVIKELKANA